MPENVFQVLPGGVEPGEAICEAPEVRMVSFTGSTRAGRAVGSLAGGTWTGRPRARRQKLVHRARRRRHRATSCGAFGTFFHHQICMASGRHLVHESIADQYISTLAERAARLPVGDPGSEEVALQADHQPAADRPRSGDRRRGGQRWGGRDGRRQERSALLPANDRRAGAEGHARLERGDLRTGRARHDLLGRGRGGRDRQRHRVRALRRGLHVLA